MPRFGHKPGPNISSFPCTWPCRHRAWQRQTRFIVIWVLFVVMALFYTIPVAAVQAIIEVDRLKGIPGFKQLVDITFTRSLIQAILPGAPPLTLSSLAPMLNRQPEHALPWTFEG